MKKIKKNILIGTIVLCIGILCVGCSEKSSSLVGEWKDSGDHTFIFYESGDFKYHKDNAVSNQMGKYKIIGESEIKFETKLHEYISEYSITDGKLEISGGFISADGKIFEKQ